MIIRVKEIRFQAIDKKVSGRRKADKAELLVSKLYTIEITF
jgi:hypothetical protein